MSDERREVTPLEAALMKLSPAPARLDRDALMFAAGRGAAAKRAWAWPVACAFFALLSLALGVRLIARPTPADPAPSSVDVPAISIPPSIDLDSPGARYGELMRRANEYGDLPPMRHPGGATDGAASPAFRPALERDLSLPPGSLDGVGPRFGASFNP